MINRRRLILIAACAAVATPVKSKSGGITLRELREEFNSKDYGTRRMIQESMQSQGYYNRGIDGAWGEGMEVAYKRFMASDQYLKVAKTWTWPRHVQIIDTLMFFTSDMYLD